MTRNFKFSFNTLALIFVNYNYDWNTLLNKLHDHLFICRIGINFGKKNLC
jgi:hypothetical protein